MEKCNRKGRTIERDMREKRHRRERKIKENDNQRQMAEKEKWVEIQTERKEGEKGGKRDKNIRVKEEETIEIRKIQRERDRWRRGFCNFVDADIAMQV